MLVKNFITIMFCYQWWWNKVSYIMAGWGHGSVCQTRCCLTHFKTHRSTVLRTCAYCCRRSSVVCRSVCLSVSLSRSWVLQKRLNRSRCRLGCGLAWVQGTTY